MDPLVVVSTKSLAIPHVPHSSELVNSLSSMLNLLLLSDSFLDIEFVCQVLVLIHDVVSLKDHITEDL